MNLVYRRLSMLLPCLLTVFVAIESFAGGDTPQIKRPVALSSSDAALFILQGDGLLLRLDAADPRRLGELRTLYDMPFVLGVDLAVGNLQGREVVAVSYYRQTSLPSAALSLIKILDAGEGRELELKFQASATTEPQLPAPRSGRRVEEEEASEGHFIRATYFAGLAFDPGAKRLYVVGATDGTIHYADLERPGRLETHILTTVRGVARLGALVLDPRTSQLFVADATDGIVYRVDVRTGRTEQLARKLGSPTALLLLPENNELLIADGLNGRIFKLSLGQKDAKPVNIAQRAGLRQPSGLALLPSGVLCVSDAWYNRLTFLDLDGTVIRHFPPR